MKQILAIYFNSDDLSLAKRLAVFYDAKPSAYRIDICEKILNGINFLTMPLSAEETSSFVATLRDNKYGEKDGHDVLRWADHWLRSQTIRADSPLEWETLACFISILDFLYYKLPQLSQEAQQILLKKYFYLALMCGLSVDDFLKGHLRYALDVVDYINVCSFYLEALLHSEEYIIGIVPEGAMRLAPFADVFKQYLEWNKKDWLNFNRVKDFCNQNAVLAKLNDNLKPAARRALELAARIHQCKIIDWLREADETFADKYDKDLNLLFLAFNVGHPFKLIISYFLKPEPLIGLLDFLEKLRNNFDSNDAEDIEHLIQFSEELKNNKLTEKDLIIFHESDGQFHWNDNI